MKSKALLLFIMVLSLFGTANATEDVGIGSGGETIYYIKTVPQPNISITPTSLSFGNVEVTQSTTLQITVENTGPGTLDIGAVTSPAAPYTISGDTCSGQHLAQYATCTLIIRFSPVAAGNFNSNFNIPSNDPGTPVATMSVSGTGITVPRITVSTNSYDFGTINLGNSSNGVITVTSSGTGDLVITGVSTPTAPFSVTGGTCAIGASMVPGSSCTINIRFTPTAIGNANGSFNISSNANNNPSVNIALTGSGSQQATCGASFSPNTINTGNGTSFQWSTTNASTATYSCTGNLGSGSLSPVAAGSSWVTPASTQLCAVTPYNSIGQAGTPCSASVTVNAVTATCNVSFSPSSVNSGGSTTVSWTSSNASTIQYSCTGNIGGGTVGPTGSSVVGPTTTQSCTLTPYNATGQAGTSCSASVTVNSTPFTCSQWFSPSVINNGDWTTFTRTHNADTIGETVTSGSYSCTGNLGGGGVSNLSNFLQGTWQVTQSQTCTTQLWTNTGKTASCPATITVNSSLPSCTASFSPNSVTKNNPTTITWSSTNATSVKYACDSNFGWWWLSTNGSQAWTPTTEGTTTCTFTAYNAIGQTGTCQATLTVNPPGGGGGVSACASARKFYLNVDPGSTFIQTEIPGFDCRCGTSMFAPCQVNGSTCTLPNNGTSVTNVSNMYYIFKCPSGSKISLASGNAFAGLNAYGEVDMAMSPIGSYGAAVAYDSVYGTATQIYCLN